jgi:hypothetical protein
MKLLVLAGEGLVAAAEINNTQACVSEPHPLLQRDPLALVVRPAVMQGRSRAVKGIGGNRSMTREESGYTTHEITLIGIASPVSL